MEHYVCIVLLDEIFYIYFNLFIQVPPLFLDVRPDHFVLDSKLHSLVIMLVSFVGSIGSKKLLATLTIWHFNRPSFLLDSCYEKHSTLIFDSQWHSLSSLGYYYLFFSHLEMQLKLSRLDITDNYRMCTCVTIF